jgi:hypothetical protein
LSMFDDLMEKDPKMRRIRAESEARGKVEGRVEGLQSSILTIIEARFPVLVGLAQQRVEALTNVDELTALLRQVLAASNEEAARSLFTSLAA